MAAAKPDDTYAYRLMADVYRYLMVQEAYLLEGKKLPVTSVAQIANIPLAPTSSCCVSGMRYMLNYAIQTTPPPTTEAGKIDLGRLHFELARRSISVNFNDLATIISRRR